MAKKRFLVTRTTSIKVVIEAESEREASWKLDEIIFDDEDNSFSLISYDSQSIEQAPESLIDTYADEDLDGLGYHLVF